MVSSILVDVKKLERYIMNLPKAKQLNTMNRDEREAMLELRDNASEAKDSIVKYVTADDTFEKAEFLDLGIERINCLTENMLNASQYDLLDAVDVAHLGAITESIKERLR